MSLADWTAEDGDDFHYEDTREPRQRGGRRKKKKKSKEQEPAVQDWDDLYDPTRPNNYEEYMHSDERVSALIEWKQRLYAHRQARRAGSSDLSSEDDESRKRRPVDSTYQYPTRFKILITLF
jgi:splicing factor 45